MYRKSHGIAATIDVDESYPDDMPAHDVAPFLSDKKAEAYRAVMLPDQLIITADTVVINKGTVLGKPHSEENAHEMLRELSGPSEGVRGVAVNGLQAECRIGLDCLEGLLPYVSLYHPNAFAELIQLSWAFIISSSRSRATP